MAAVEEVHRILQGPPSDADLHEVTCGLGAVDHTNARAQPVPARRHFVGYCKTHLRIAVEDGEQGAGLGLWAREVINHRRRVLLPDPQTELHLRLIHDAEIRGGPAIRRLPLLVSAVATHLVKTEDVGDALIRLVLGFDVDFPGLGSRSGGDGLVQRAAGKREVLLKLVARKEKGFSEGVEGAAAAVVWEVLCVYLDAEEFFDGVLVFALVEAAHRDDAARVGERLPRGHHGAGEMPEELRLLGRLRLLLFLGRHLA